MMSCAAGCEDVPGLSEDQAHRLSGGLKRWSERPVRQANLRAVGIGLVTVAMMTIAANQTPDPIPVMHGIAILFAATQSVAHVVTVGVLRAFAALGIAEAPAALASYRDPRRLSAMDMAAAWLACAAVTRLFGE